MEIMARTQIPDDYIWTQKTDFFKLPKHSSKGYTLQFMLTFHWRAKGMELERSQKRISVLM